MKMEKRSKINNVLKVFLVLTMFLITVSSALAAVSEIGTSPYTNSGTWAADSGRGKEYACDYNNILYVLNGDTVHKYSTSSWEYIGSETLDASSVEIKCRGNKLFVSNANNITRIDISSFTIDETYNFPDITSITTFDVDNDENLLAATGGTKIYIMDYNTKNIDVNISKSGSAHIEFSWDGEVILSDVYNTYRYFPTGYSTATGAQLFQGSFSDGYSRDMAVSPTDDRYIIARRLSTYRYLYEYNFTSGSIAGLYTSPQTTEEIRAGRYSPTGQLFSRFEAGGIYDYVSVYTSVDGTGLGSVKGNDYETPAWTAFTEGDRYLVVGTESYLRVYSTGEAAPLVTTSDAEIQIDESVLFEYTLLDLGDIVDADCTVEYKVTTDSTWLNFGWFDYNPGDGVPNTVGAYEFSLVENAEYEYRAACEYYTGNVHGFAYGQTKTLTFSPEPFDIFGSILDNFSVVMFLMFIVFVVIVLAAKGITNIIAILTTVVLLSFVGYFISILNLTIVVFTIVICSIILLFSMLLGGKE